MADDTLADNSVRSETVLPAQAAADVVYVIDISSYIFRAYHALPPLSTTQGEPSHAVKGVADMLARFLREQQPKRVVVALDTPGESKRREIFPEYKANRPPPPDDLRSQIDRVKQLLDAWRIPKIGVAGYEADDVIATIVREAAARDQTVVILSADKDLLQLVGDRCIMYDSMRDKVYGVPETIEKLGVPPTQVRDLLALMGDSSDNVPGVPGVGAKTAAALLKAHKTIEGIYEALESMTKKALKKKLAENKDQAMLSRQLVSLDDSLALGDWFDKAGQGLPPGASSPELKKLLLELEFTRLLAQLGSPDTTDDNEGATDGVPAAHAGESYDGSQGRYTTIVEHGALHDFLRRAQAQDDVGIYVHADRVDGVLKMRGVAVALTPGQASYVDAETTAKAHNLLSAFLRNALVRKAVFDVKANAHASAAAKMVLRGASFDAMLASYVLEPGRRAHSIVEVAQAELGAELSLLPKKDVTPQALAVFCAERADFSLRLARLYQERFTSSDLGHVYRDIEMPLTEVLFKLERTGVAIDEIYLAELSGSVSKQIDVLEKRAYRLAGREFNLGSPKQIEPILFDELLLPVIKKTKTGRSTDQTVLEELALMHELPKMILEWRGLSKLRNTYLDALPLAVSTATKRIHTNFNQAVARDRSFVLKRSELAKHTDPNRAWPKSARCLRRQKRVGDFIG